MKMPWPTNDPARSQPMAGGGTGATKCPHSRCSGSVLSPLFKRRMILPALPASPRCAPLADADDPAAEHPLAGKDAATAGGQPATAGISATSQT